MRREMMARLRRFAGPTASGRRGRIAGRSANCGARSARRISSRPQARDRARAMRRWPGKVERAAAHGDRRYQETLSAYSTPLTPHTIAQWHTTATFLRRPPGDGGGSPPAFHYLMLRLKLKYRKTRGNGHGDKSIRLDGVTPGAGRLLHRNGLAGSRGRGAGAGKRARQRRAFRAGRAHRLAHPSGRPDALYPLRASVACRAPAVRCGKCAPAT